MSQLGKQLQLTMDRHLVTPLQVKPINPEVGLPQFSDHLPCFESEFQTEEVTSLSVDQTAEHPGYLTSLQPMTLGILPQHLP